MSNGLGGDPAYLANRQGRKVTVVGALVNLGLIVFKAIAGVLGNSQALIADAVHSLSDLATDVVVLAGLAMGRRAPDERHQFGHGRLETMASGLVGLALMGAGAYIGYEAGLALYLHQEQAPTWPALAGAVASIVCKEALYRYTMATAKRMKSRLLAANAWHHRSDALSSLAVLAGVGAAMLNPAWHLADAIAALAVAVLVFKVGFDVTREALIEMSDAAPAPGIMENINRCILGVPGVEAVNQLQVRTLGGLYEVQVSIVVDGNLSVFQSHAIAVEVEKCLASDVENTGEVMVHVDPKASGAKASGGVASQA